MKHFERHLKLTSLVAMAIIASIITTMPIAVGAPKTTQISTTAQNYIITDTTKSMYHQREKATIEGTATFNGQPVSNALVGIEIRDPQSRTIAYRTTPIGSPSEQWILAITDIKMYNTNFQQIDTAKIGQNIILSVSVQNLMFAPLNTVVITLSLYDGNMIPLQAIPVYSGSIDAQATVSVSTQTYVPKWAYSGIATVYASVFDRTPALGGIPYIPEQSARFYISRTQQGMFGYSMSAPAAPQPPAGTYSSTFSVPPSPQPGQYSAYTTIRYNSTFRATNSSTFGIESVPSPPTASFVFSPNNPYPNQTVTFDASSSSPEGFNDTIIRYAWDFGDGVKLVKTGTPSNPPDPTATHNFLSLRQYTVTLNVSDTENLWATASKPLTTAPTNPTAVFTIVPQRSRINATVTFNATASLPGWSIPKGNTAPIATYAWTFGDGGSATVTNPVTTHVYTTAGNFTVTLTVTDTQNQQNSVSHIVSVSSMLYPAWDVNQDGVVDIKDLAITAAAYGSSPGSPNWNPICDMNGDLRIDIKDLAIIAHYYGQRY